MFSTPVLFLIFNRPDTTRKVFEQIQKLKPKYLFIAADAPRLNKEGEKEKCELVKKIVLDGINWDCNVKTLFQEENLGCGFGPATAITWFFEHVEQGIILEDDCVPVQSFFPYCEELLQKYQDNEKVMHISGTSFQFGKRRGVHSYYFSIYPHEWGWASWRRAWSRYNIQIENLDEFAANKSYEIFQSKRERDYWLRILQTVKNKNNHEVDTWDYQWAYIIWKNNGICITPNQNLVSNIGFSPDATHTTHLNHPLDNIPSFELDYISHPCELKLNRKADAYIFHKAIHRRSFNLANNIRNIAYKYFPSIWQKMKKIKETLIFTQI
ncbi:nucleotide-diphospho-sugar transferase [Xanthocytophaga agilis]|uniref:Nucleotide-diphospho-sugar transferase n=1 Tax=Xanthocytophaga agilis TaxID=3048010 RepID=A0AAE3UE89_9BACT|nr:nucleotide-diphospho-sugar transferase [Xanthocytophaga agilis]MDJ1502648.1 nucleotide-diphospho-sugar transferase [Xanthocytophaga agilis]